MSEKEFGYMAFVARIVRRTSSSVVAVSTDEDVRRTKEIALDPQFALAMLVVRAAM